MKAITRIRVADDTKAMPAAPAVAQLNRDLEGEWRAKVRGEKPRASRRYDDAVLDARGLGFAYVPTAELTLPDR